MPCSGRPASPVGRVTSRYTSAAIAYYIDIAFPASRLAIEIDGREFHVDSVAFEKDRWRQNDLVNAGWRVLRFTARMVEESPELVVAMILEALAA